ncbi:hypothetical protein, partial [Enterocloster sp.]|uniref:hypothetical protein n=1 Tax=Enterocloster sp. TaxID=2719315 RepID=UPI0030806E62
YGIIFRATQSVELFCAYVSTINRMFSDPSHTSRNSVIAVSFAFGLSVYKKNKLLNAFFPEEKVYDQLLKEKLDIYEANDRLAKKRLTLLGHTPKN